MTQLAHRTEHVNGIPLHFVEAGEGPLVLFVHGFPESRYSWRHQLPALADAGYHAVAIDVRGYGRSGKPPRVDDYRMMLHVGDNVGLVHALGEETAVVVGHDWGAPIAWNSALVRPDVFRAVAGLSVPFNPVGPMKPSEAFRLLGGEDEFYIEYFSHEGVAEAEIERDVRRWLLGFYFSISGDTPSPGDGGPLWLIPHGHEISERFHFPATMPAWLSDVDLDVYVGEFERSGLRGGLNRYRNVDRDWADFQAYAGRVIDVPALFIGGERDGPTLLGAGAIAKFPRTLPRLHRSIILEGCGHWTQQERPDEVNEAVLDFLGSL